MWQLCMGVNANQPCEGKPHGDADGGSPTTAPLPTFPSLNAEAGGSNTLAGVCVCMCVRALPVYISACSKRLLGSPVGIQLPIGPR